MSEEEFKITIAELIKLGEDQGKLGFWLSIFPHLPPDKQKRIFNAFAEELEKLNKLN